MPPCCACVETLVDVRRYPSSRRNPQFGKDAPAETLEQAGIAYRHASSLLAARGHEVVHLLRPGDAEPHGLSNGAEARSGKLFVCGQPLA